MGLRIHLESARGYQDVYISIFIDENIALKIFYNVYKAQDGRGGWSPSSLVLLLFEIL